MSDCLGAHAEGYRRSSRRDLICVNFETDGAGATAAARGGA
ncbi:MAG: hypothetical protein OEM98_00170 [Gammaproteobacteria bacterium]|nr:hypothetical protein [Gammaproteobacteria bacterium]